MSSSDKYFIVGTVWSAGSLCANGAVTGFIMLVVGIGFLVASIDD